MELFLLVHFFSDLICTISEMELFRLLKLFEILFFLQAMHNIATTGRGLGGDYGVIKYTIISDV